MWTKKDHYQPADSASASIFNPIAVSAGKGNVKIDKSTLGSGINKGIGNLHFLLTMHRFRPLAGDEPPQLLLLRR